MSINTKALSPSTLNLFKDCFEINGSPKQKKKIEWQYFKNPPSSCFVDIAYDDEEQRTAAIYAVSSVFFKVGVDTVLGAQSLDTMTDIQYRGKGFFTKLAKNVYRNAQENNVGLVYGFPNGNSIHGFKKKLEWKVLDPVPFLIKPLKTGYFTNKMKFLKFIPNFNLPIKRFKPSKNFKIIVDNSFPIEVNYIWEKFSKEFEVGVIRDQQYLNWRYLIKPIEGYNVAHVRGAADEYLGYIVYIVKQKHEGKIGYIMEHIYDPSLPELGSHLLKFAIQKLKDINADCILSWCLDHSPNYNSYKNNFFLKMPERIRPIELHFGARSFQPKIAALVNDRRKWYLSYSDSDTV